VSTLEVPYYQLIEASCDPRFESIECGPMLKISAESMDALAEQRTADFALEIVADWFEIYRVSEGHSPSIPFDEAWDVAVAAIEQVQARSRYIPDGATAQLIHRLLSAAERGCAAPKLAAAIDNFINAMPSDQAALILVELELVGTDG